MEHEFSRQIFGKFQVPNLMKIRPLGAKSFHTDGRAEGHEEVKSCFSQFCENAYEHTSQLDVPAQ